MTDAPSGPHGQVEVPEMDGPVTAPPGGEPEGARVPSPEPVVVSSGPDDPVYRIPTGPAPELAQFSMALVASLSVDLPNQHPTVVLRESESPRRQLSFSLGLNDAVALSHAMRRIPTPRPLTPELLSTVLVSFDIDVVAVRLVGRQGAVYFAELDLRGRNGRSVQSCRPSDALTVALLQPVPVPILIDHRLFEELGDVRPVGPPA